MRIGVVEDQLQLSVHSSQRVLFPCHLTKQLLVVVYSNDFSKPTLSEKC